jgi:rhodanese-related sulfurtransferase
MTGLTLSILLPALAQAPASTSPAPACSVQTGTLLEADRSTSEVSTDEMRRIVADQSAIVLDARPHAEFAISHIPGAVNVSQKPGTTMALYVSDVKEVERIAAGRKGAPLVLYCNGPYCGKSKRLAGDLAAAGFTNVRRYQLGIPVWRALGGVTQIELGRCQVRVPERQDGGVARHAIAS